MKPVYRRLTALMVVFSMAFSSFGCTTMKPIPLTEPGDAVKQIKAGDKIQYRTALGRPETLKVTSVGDKVLRGTSEGQVKEVKVADVKSIEKREINFVGALLASLGLFVLVFGTMVATNADKIGP